MQVHFAVFMVVEKVYNSEFLLLHQMKEEYLFEILKVK